MQVILCLGKKEFSHQNHQTVFIEQNGKWVSLCHCHYTHFLLTERDWISWHIFLESWEFVTYFILLFHTIMCVCVCVCVCEREYVVFCKKQVGLIAIRRILWYIQKSSCVKKLWNKGYLSFWKPSEHLDMMGIRFVWLSLPLSGSIWRVLRMLAMKTFSSNFVVTVWKGMYGSNKGTF